MNPEITDAIENLRKACSSSDLGLVVAVASKPTQETAVHMFNMEGVSATTVGQAMYLHVTKNNN